MCSSETHSHSLKIVLVALAQLAGDHGLGLAHVLDGTLNCDNALEVEAVDVVDTADGNLRVGILHDSLDSVTAFSDNSTNKIVVRKDLQDNLTGNKQRTDAINISTESTIRLGERYKLEILFTSTQKKILDLSSFRNNNFDCRPATRA